MKRLFLIDAYALIFKYYYAFMNRPMRNRAGMNTSILFGFTKFLRDIQKREKPDLLGVAIDPKGGSFRGDIFPEYKANRPATPEDIIASVPYVCRLLKAMRIPIFEVAGYEADDVIGTLALKGEQAGFDVYMVTPDKDYGQLVGAHRHIYKQKGDGVEIIRAEDICAKYGIPDPVLVRDILAIWGDQSDNIPGVPGIGEKGACKLVGELGEVENILANLDSIKGKQREKIEAWGDKLLLSKRLTTICTDVPVEFNAEALEICEPNYNELKALYSELDFTLFMRDLHNLAPEDPTASKQDPQHQLIDATRNRVAQAKEKSLQGQGDLFAMFEAPAAEPAARNVAIENSTNVATEATPQAVDETIFEQDDEPLVEQLRTIHDTPHTYHLIREEQALRELVERLSREKEFCFDTETTGFDIYRDRIVGLSLSVEAHEAWYVEFTELNSELFAEVVRPLFENETISKVAQNMKFDIMVLRRLGIEVRGEKIDTMILHYLLDPESRHNMNYMAERYLRYHPIEIETLIGRGARQLTMDQVNIEAVKEYAAEDADITLQLKHMLWPQIEEQGLVELYRKVEEPMIEVLCDMEIAGVKIDSEQLSEYAVELNRELQRLEQEIRTEADEPMLNVNSARQLGEVLFGKLKISDKPKMTKTRQYSTDEEYLQGFA